MSYPIPFLQQGSEVNLTKHRRVTRRRRAARRGFALVATLLLMALLLVVAVGLLGLSSITLRGSQATEAKAAACANARLALLLALNDLQKYTGPDQRTTANAEILTPPGTATGINLKWTGVWATTQPTDPKQALSVTNPPEPTKPVVTGGADPNYPEKVYLSDYRNRPGYTKNSLLLAWLVSGSPSTTIDPTKEKPEGITLVEKAAGLADADAPDPKGDRIQAPLVKIGSGTAQAGGMAYWIGDESMKARIDQLPTDQQPNATNPQDGGMARLAGGEGPNLRFVKSGSDTPYAPVADAKAADRAKLITAGSVGLLVPPDKARKNFHDLTAYSESVLADARDGGLKKDLTTYINQPDKTAPPAISDIAETGLADDSTNASLSGHPMLPGPLFAKFGPNFLQLRNWYQLSKKVTGSFNSGSMDPVFLKTRASVAGRGDMPDMKSREQSVQPVIAEARLSFDFSLDTARGAGTALRTHVYPKVKLWNPYNVTLKAHSYLIGFPRHIDITAAGYTVQPITTRDPSNNSIRYYGDLPGELLYFVLEAVDLAPGECLFFSPKTSGESSRYDPSNVASNVLSPAVPAGGTANFYFDADARLQAVTPPAQIIYGITSANLGSRPMRSYLLKDAGSSAGTITNANAQSSLTYPIIQKLAMDSAGDNTSWAAVGNPFPNPGGTNSVPMKVSGAHVGAVPLASWYMGARLRMIDENVNEEAGGYGGTPGKYPIKNPLVSAFNIRSQIVHRSNFCAQFDWVWWTVGPYINSRADQVITDNSMKGRRKAGKELAAPFGKASDYSNADSFAMFEVPRKELPPFSLANFQHAQLGYQSWQPSYMVGNSFANGRSDRKSMVHFKDKSLATGGAYYEEFKTTDLWDSSFRCRYSTGVWGDLIQYTAGEPRELLIYDSLYAVNHALWDRYFLSTMDFDNQGNAKFPPQDHVQFANPRMVMSPYSGKDPDEIRKQLAGKNDFDSAAYFLMQQGSFNINSTSIEAWRAFFSSMNDVQRPLREGSSTVARAFSRLLLPGTAAQASSHLSAGAWDGAKTLSQAEVDRMAVAMVKNVKARGPFLGLADFVNRRLAPNPPGGSASPPYSNTDDPTMCGPLQAAIEGSGVNRTLQQTASATDDQADSDTSAGGWLTGRVADRHFYPDAKLFSPWRSSGFPGYLTQADILQGAGANITARGDTFVIRAYGDKRDATGQIIARAWCEAVVQRTPDYLSAAAVDQASDAKASNPMEPMVVRSTKDYSATLNPKLNDMNKKFGRRYVIKDFRWLDPSEV